MELESYNPIYSVDGESVPCPSSYKWKLQDLSESDSGRTQDGVMDKMRQSQLVAIELKWKNVSISDGSKILKAFNPEYITVKYLDAMDGQFRESVFYTGDRNAPLYNSRLGIWQEISFNIIEREGRKEKDV